MLFGFDRYLAVLLTAAVVTYVLTPRVRRWAFRVGAVDMPSSRRPHQRPTPRGGGFGRRFGGLCGVRRWVGHGRGGASGRLRCPMVAEFFPASLILLVVGVVDDVRGMKAWQKLAGQILAASWVAFSGARFGSLFQWELPGFLDRACVVAWVVAVINAYNLIDGLDGLASGLAVISATGLCGALALGNLPGVVLPLVALVGACLAFLRYNFHPATIFLGDTGSMTLGLMLGVVSLQTFTKNTFMLSMSIPLLILGVPIYDTLLAIWRRSVRSIGSRANREAGAPPRGIMAADVEHLHHRLTRAGLGTRRVAVVLCVLNAGLVAFGLLMEMFQSHAAGIFLLALLALAYVLMRHMAVIELRETGQFLLTGLRRPTHSQLRALAYPIWDMLCLAGGLAAAMRLSDNPGGGFWHSWFLDLPIWVTPTFSLLAMSRAYVTIWTRARVLDVLMLLLALQAGLLCSVGIALLIDPSAAPTALLRAVIMAAVGHGAIVFSRVFYRCAEEVVLYLKSSGAPDAGAERSRSLWSGRPLPIIPSRAQLSPLFRHCGRGLVIVGLIDDEPSLHFRWVCGHMVLGGLRELSQLIARHRITGLIVTTNLKPQNLEAARQLAAERHLHLTEWRFESLPLDTDAAESPVLAAEACVD